MTHCNCKLLYENAVIWNRIWTSSSPFCWDRWPATLSSRGCNSSRGSRRKATCDQWVTQCVPAKSFKRRGLNKILQSWKVCEQTQPSRTQSKTFRRRFFNETESKIIKWNDVTVNLQQILDFKICSPDIDWQCLPQSHIHPCHCCLESGDQQKERQLCKNTQRDGVSKKEATMHANLQKRHRELVGCKREVFFLLEMPRFHCNSSLTAVGISSDFAASPMRVVKILFQSYSTSFVFVCFF